MLQNKPKMVGMKARPAGLRIYVCCQSWGGDMTARKENPRFFRKKRIGFLFPKVMQNRIDNLLYSLIINLTELDYTRKK
jgi:hypothetical protein